MNKKTTLTLICLLCIGLASHIPAPVQAIQQNGYADEAFHSLWMRTDQPVADGTVNRSWLWGERPGEQRYEQYHGVAGNARLVQYFDKGRMEITNPSDDRASSWFVTCGPLVVEMVSGRIRIGKHDIDTRNPATIPIAGDPTNNAAPTYAMIGPITTINGGDNRAPAQIGNRVDATYGTDGIGNQPDLALPETEIVFYEETTGHNIPRVFHNMLQSTGLVIEHGQLVHGQVFDAVFTFGYPITEPYWIEAHIGGKPTTVLFQAFERRILTYTPSNKDPWKIQVSNIGQHYLHWRYGHTLRYAQPPIAEGIRTYDSTIDIPTYGYQQALVPTTPEDPVYPYSRLDTAQVAAPQIRTYRTIVVENQFLTLTFLPELGGRLYKAVQKATGNNIFYQNPVVKPSPFGQRGWWLGPGGLEWAAPTEEHGYMEHMPWDVAITPIEQGQGVTVQNTISEQQTGVHVAGSVSLRAGEGRFHVTMQAINDTDASPPWQMWTNAVLAPGASNTIGPDFHFVAPTDTMIVHATQDEGLPAAGETMPWPMVGGRDMRYPKKWTGYVGAFTNGPVPFLGMYDTQQDEGAAIVHGADTPGAKVFGFSENFDSSLYTDDGSQYIELWSGAQTTFWDYPPLAAGATRTINTDWLPLWGIGDLMTATVDGALGLTQRPDGGTTVGIATARVINDAVVVVRVDGQEVFRTAPVELRPDLPLSIDLPMAVVSGSHVQVEAGGVVWGGVV